MLSLSLAPAAQAKREWGTRVRSTTKGPPLLSEGETMKLPPSRLGDSSWWVGRAATVELAVQEVMNCAATRPVLFGPVRGLRCWRPPLSAPPLSLRWQKYCRHLTSTRGTALPLRCSSSIQCTGLDFDSNPIPLSLAKKNYQDLMFTVVYRRSSLL